MFVCMFVQRVCVCALRGLAAAAATEIERLENQCVCVSLGLIVIK